MYTVQESVSLNVNESKVVLNGLIILSFHQCSQSKHWTVNVARPGYSNSCKDLVINSAINCNFGDLYEVRLLSADPYHAELLITKLPVMESAESIFYSSNIFTSTNNTDNFSNEEVVILKEQLAQLSQRITMLVSEMKELTEAQNAYLKSSFNMLNEKLNTGSKESWRQAAYGVVASVACTFMPDAQTAQNLFQIAESYISSAPGLLLNHS